MSRKCHIKRSPTIKIHELICREREREVKSEKTEKLLFVRWNFFFFGCGDFVKYVMFRKRFYFLGNANEYP